MYGIFPIEISPLILVIVFAIDGALSVFRFWYTPDWTHLGKAIPKFSVAVIYLYLFLAGFAPRDNFQASLVRDAWLLTGITGIAYNLLRIFEKLFRHRSV